MKPYETPDVPVTKVEELDIEYGRYTYADYLKWKFEDMVELIKGKIYRMSPGPRENHQRVSSNLHTEIGILLKKLKCRVYSAPFDVRLSLKGETADKDITTVVQPDLCVICDLSKLDEKGCLGAPELVIEILSPSSARKDTHEKMDVYAEAGVPELWLVHPIDCLVTIYTLAENDYTGSKPFATGDIIESKTIPGLKINLSEVFENLDNPLIT